MSTSGQNVEGFAASQKPSQREREGDGALGARQIADLMRAGFISGGVVENIRPASLDLSLSDEIYCVDGVFQPKPSETIRDLLKLIKKKVHDIDEPLLRGKIYLARLNETLALPESVYGYCNPKSTSGRLDLHVRVLADGVARYDATSAGGYTGELWMVLQPKSFSVLVHKGATLAQLRLFNRDTRFAELQLELAMREHKLLWRQKEKSPLLYSEIKIRDNDGSLILTLDLAGDVLGYRCLSPDTVLDIRRVNMYNAEDFFEPLTLAGGHLKLARDEFYILSSREAVRVPPELACEMAPMDERSGDFRSHYAGFIDPGWGWGKSGEGVGRPLTLEVRPFEDLLVRHGQPVAKIKFERMSEVPDMSYDAIGSNYLSQNGPRLAKQFVHKKEIPKKK
jgi:dCTP deaminase